MSKTRKLLISAAVAAAVAAAPAAPAHAASGVAYSFKNSGLSAIAFFSDVPQSGPVARTVYHDTFVNAGESTFRANGTSTKAPFVVVDQLVYSFDRRGNFIFLSETGGFFDGSGVRWSADKKLTAASVSASVPVDRCDEAGNCTPGGSIAVDVQWTGYGAISKAHDSFHYSSEGIHYTFRASGTSRAATAVSSFPGSTQYAELDDSTSAERCVGTAC
jgi:hypothetical protein